GGWVELLAVAIPDNDVGVAVAIQVADREFDALVVGGPEGRRTREPSSAVVEVEVVRLVSQVGDDYVEATVAVEVAEFDRHRPFAFDRERARLRETSSPVIQVHAIRSSPVCRNDLRETITCKVSHSDVARRLV